MPALFAFFSAKLTQFEQQRKQPEAPLFEQIGQLRVENDWLKQIANQLTIDRNTLIVPTDKEFAGTQQNALLGLARSTDYYQPVDVTVENLALSFPAVSSTSSLLILLANTIVDSILT